MVDYAIMEKDLTYLIEYLLRENSQRVISGIPHSQPERRRLLRALMNVREPKPVDAEFLRVQDRFLQEEARQKGIVDVAELPATKADSRIALWQGDITRLKADAIVNAANSAMLGCFVPCHGCIDNAIHSAAGVQLRNECAEIMRQQGHPEPTGSAKITGAYNLPSKHVLHTVGPIISGRLTEKDCADLASCYRSCLELSEANGLKSVAFCCISTGEFHFPNQTAAEIAVSTVSDYLNGQTAIERVVFNVFKDADYEIYKGLLG